jgi:DNA-binding transcriptional LysR family regulator
MHLALRQLRHVLVLDQFRNFARAAEALGLTQPALSRSIQLLEKSIGARLFDRGRSHVEPTVIGARLIDQARKLLNHASDVEKDLRQMLGLEVGLLKIGAGPYSADISVGTAVGRLLRAHPGLRVDLSVDDWTSLIERVLLGEIDLAIAEISLAAEDPRLIVDPMPIHEATFFCRPGHRLTDCRSPTLADLRKYPLVAPSLPARLAQLTDSKNARTPYGLPATVAAPEIRVGTFDLARRIVMESDAIGIAQFTQIENEVAQGRLVTVPLQLPWLKTNFGIIRLANRTPAPAAIAFMAILREVESGIA